MDDVRGIEGTPVFTGVEAQQGYAINKMCFSFNDEANREAFRADADRYMSRYGLSDDQRDAVKSGNVLRLISVGGNVYYLAKLAGILGLNVQDLGAQQTGMSLDAFKQYLVDQGK